MGFYSNTCKRRWKKKYFNKLHCTSCRNKNDSNCDACRSFRTIEPSICCSLRCLSMSRKLQRQRRSIWSWRWIYCKVKMAKISWSLIQSKKSYSWRNCKRMELSRRFFKRCYKSWKFLRNDGDNNDKLRKIIRSSKKWSTFKTKIRINIRINFWYDGNIFRQRWRKKFDS